MVAQRTFNPLVQGSNPCAPTKICSVRLSVRTPPFHGGKRGSIPLPSTICKYTKAEARPWEWPQLCLVAG